MNANDLSYLQEVYYTTSKYNQPKKGKITALGKKWLTINRTHVYNVETGKLKSLYPTGGAFYVNEQDYWDEKEYEKNCEFLRSAFYDVKDRLTLDQTRRIIQIMSE